MIPAPNLDDRSFDDIVQEAITLIPKYCPEWTNHNNTDPGITLIELFAWMIEMVIYRLNKVTDKNYLKFLELMGVELQPPQPAHAVLQFVLTGKVEQREIGAGTRVATRQTASQDAVVFETSRNLTAINNKLVKCFCQHHDSFADHSLDIDGQRPAGFPVFMGAKTIDREIYLGDVRFEKLSDAALLKLNFTAPETVGTDFPRFLEWSFWNGNRWKEMVTSAMEFSRGGIVFEQIDKVEETEINGIKAHWIRGKLIEVPQSLDATVLDTVTTSVEIVGEGVEPDLVLTNDDQGLFLIRDLSKSFAPFTDTPKTESTLYLCSEEYLSQAGARIRLEIRLADPVVRDPPRAHPELRVAWEFYDGRVWREMARCTPDGVEESLEGLEFADSTRAFTGSGAISFLRPESMAPAPVNGDESFWLRARIVQGNYGEPGQYELDGEKWVWHNENPLKPPYIKAMTLNYSEQAQAPEHVYSYNDFHFHDFTDVAAKEMKPFQPFAPIPEESPAIYFGFDRALPHVPVSLYVNTAETLVTAAHRKFQEHLQRHYAAKDTAEEQRLVWEYWNGQWTDLAVMDETQNFTQPGFIDFIGPKDFFKTKRFSEEAFWIRVRLEMGGYVEMPHINHVALNCVYALNQRTVENEVLGDSDGTPNQHFRTRYAPVLDAEMIWVRERERPTDEEIFQLREAHGTEDIFEEATDDVGGYWVRWLHVDSFYASHQRSRHYKKDTLTGEIWFGDGGKGMAPPMGQANVVARSYYVGGGAKGNVGAGAINTLKRSISYVESVFNPYPAFGGCDLETIESVKERGPYMIRSRERAVTREDFEWLAMQASSSIARAACLPSTSREGEVTVIIIPKFDEIGSDYQERLTPSTELIRRVKLFLDERRLVTTLVRVEKPRYVEISVRVAVIRATTGSSEKLKREIEEALRVFLHPIRGGRNGKGWPFGRNVLKMDLYHVVEEVDGVEFVDGIRLVDEDNKTEVDQIRIGAGQLPHLVDVDITEKAREKLI